MNLCPKCGCILDRLSGNQIHYCQPSTRPVKLVVDARVRYWEDATVNSYDDVLGKLIPFRDGDSWKPTIDIERGEIVGWPSGTTASIYYKVCDAGDYWLADQDGTKRLKWNGDYVPDDLLCVGGRGHGDYIILTVQGDGKIRGWPHGKGYQANPEQWDPVEARK